MKKRIVSKLMIILVVCAGLVIPTFAYNRTTAVSYANTYALSYNSNYRSFAGQEETARKLAFLKGKYDG